MELKLANEILRIKPELTSEEAIEQARDIFEYWVDSCLPDVLEAS